jgi:hypothetical protein
MMPPMSRNRESPTARQVRSWSPATAIAEEVSSMHCRMCRQWTHFSARRRANEPAAVTPSSARKRYSRGKKA